MDKNTVTNEADRLCDLVEMIGGFENDLSYAISSLCWSLDVKKDLEPSSLENVFSTYQKVGEHLQSALNSLNEAEKALGEHVKK